MKFQKLTALLALSTIELHSNLFGKKPFAKLDEDQLEKIENALEERNTTELEAKLSTTEKEKEEAVENVSNLNSAVEQALQHAGLEPKGSVIESIALLGEKCKEFGDSKDRHNFPENSGKEEETELIDGYINPNDAHNKLIEKYR